jgi:hypothetical protein
MNARKFFVLFAIVTMLTIMISSVSFAATRTSKKAKKEVAKVEVWAESGETKVEEAKPETKAEEATSGDVKEETKVVSGDNKANEVVEDAKLVSGDTKAEEVKEEVETTSGEAKTEESASEPVSGDVEIIKVEDVSENDWFKPYVETVVDKGIMGLDENNNFNPDEVVTTKDTLDAISAAKDVSYTVVNEKAAEEFMKKDITREETAHIVYQYAKSVDKGFKGTWAFLLEYKDKEAIDEDAYEAVCWCTMNKILVGRDDNTFDPKATTTRAELATIVTRMIDNV